MLSALIFATALAAEPATTSAEAPSPGAGGHKPDVWSPRHPVALGLRGLVWAGEYTAPGIGGHLRIRPWKRFGVELFADHTMQHQDPSWLHDNVIGFHTFFPLLKATRFYIAPTVGACVDFRVLAGPGPDVTDVRFAPHAGLQAEVHLIDGVALEVGGTFYAYLGNDVAKSGWTGSTSSRLQFTPTGQATVAVNYAF